VLDYNVTCVAVGLHQCTATHAVCTGLNAGTLQPDIAHALAAVAAVLSTMCRNPNVGLSHVECYCCRAISSGVGGKSLSQHGGKSSESVQCAMLKACDACADMGQL